MWSFAVAKTAVVRNGAFPAISVNKDITVINNCSPMCAPELKDTQEEKNICDLTTIRTAVTPYHEPKGSQEVRNTDISPRTAEVNSKRMSSVSPDSFIFPSIAKS